VEAHKAPELAPGVASWRALGTSAVVAMTEPSALETGRALVQHELDAIDFACSRFRSDSELTRVNAAAGEETEVSPLLFEAIQTAHAAARASAGLVDPTIGRTLRLAGYDRTFAIVRGRDGRHFTPSFTRGPDWQTIRLDENSRTVRAPAGVELDLGATAKALAADRAAARVFAATASGVLVSLGGDIAVAGPPPPGGWSVRIAEDHAEPLDGPGPVVAITSGGLATSGTTVRSWTSREGSLHHIIDPRTGRTASSHWRTVSVAAASCVDANTASTAAIVIGEEAPDWLAEGGLPSRLVRYDGAVTVVGGWPEGST
jgi:thiamine biosynthesis lipoprotein